MGVPRLGAVGEVLLQAHIPEDGVEFTEVGNMQDADFVVPRDELLSYGEQPTTTFFWSYMIESLWYLRPDFLGKTPSQQWRLRIGQMAFDVYNFSDSRQVERAEVLTVAEGIAAVDAHFPIDVSHVPGTIAVIDKFKPSVDSTRSYACAASVHNNSGVLSLGLQGGAFSDMPYSDLIPLPFSKAVPVHESVHFGLDTKLSQQWRDAGFSWKPIRTPQRGLHKLEDGAGVYRANQPNACITLYGKEAEFEDIPDSVVAYLGGARQRLHPAKRRVLKNNDFDQEPLTPKLRSVTPERPQLPRVLRYVAADIRPKFI